MTPTRLIALAGLVALTACADEARRAEAPTGVSSDPFEAQMQTAAAAGEGATPDLALTWSDGCTFGEIVPMGWERLRGEEMNPRDPVAARKALSTLPRLIVYRGDEPIYHQNGYGPGMEAMWPEADADAIAGARLADLDEGASADGALAAMTDTPGLTFVQFGAEWCTPCKAQAAAIAARRDAEAAVRFVTIDADPQKWGEGDAYPVCSV